jgi:hypothetical protein
MEIQSIRLTLHDMKAKQTIARGKLAIEIGPGDPRKTTLTGVALDKRG